MKNIKKATERDFETIASIGKSALKFSHGESCPKADMDEFLAADYSDTAILEQLNDKRNAYYIIYYKEQAVGFSNIVMNAQQSNIKESHVTKLDRIYLLKEFYGLKLGLELLQFNIQLSKKNNQSGMYLYTWVGNQRAINFYLQFGFTIIGNGNFKVSHRHTNPTYQMFLQY